MDSTRTATGGEIAADALDRLGVTVVFCVASVHNLPILNAISHTDRIRTINVRHEQAAVHAADGYARATGRLGVAITSTGPGAANSMGGLFEAGFACSPVLMITGQIDSKYIGSNNGFLHQADHQPQMLSSITKSTRSVRHTEEIGRALVDAGRDAMTGRRGPVAVEIPIDLQYQTIPRPTAVPPVEPARLRPAPQQIAEAAALIRAAERPLIWAGGGVIASDASDELAAFARELRIPIVTSTQGRGCMPDGDPMLIGAQTASEPYRELYRSSDLLIAVGTHFQVYPTDFWAVEIPPLVHIDVDPTVIDRNYRSQAAVIGDAREALVALRGEVGSRPVDETWLETCRAAGGAARTAAMDELGTGSRQVCESMRAALPDSAVLVCDSTVPAYRWGNDLFAARMPRTLFRPNSAAIGPGLPLGIGAAVATDGPVAIIHGDGGLMLSIGELVTATQYGLHVILCVFNDKGYGVLRQIESSAFGDEQHDVDLATPDFVTVAEGMGWTAERVDTADAFDGAFTEAVARQGPTLIEIDLLALDSPAPAA